MELGDLVKLVPMFISWVESIFPREVQGIVIVLAAVIALVGFGWWHYRKVSVPVQYATKKFASRQSKVRQVAETLGFAVEDVERDVPQFSKGSLYTLNRKKFPRYTWTHPFAFSGKWELLCRPGEYSSSVGVLGWVLQGSPPPGHKRPSCCPPLRLSVRRSIGGSSSCSAPS